MRPVIFLITAGIGALAALAAVGAANGGPIDRDCRYATFDETNVRGVVGACGVTPGRTDGYVDVLLDSDAPGVVWLCLVRPSGSRACGTVNPQFSSFGAGCNRYRFFISVGDEPVTHVGLYDTGVTQLVPWGELQRRPKMPVMNSVERSCFGARP